MYTADNDVHFDMHDARMTRTRSKYPVCSVCGEHIQSEWRYREDDTLYCEDCWERYVTDNIREYNDEEEY